MQKGDQHRWLWVMLLLSYKFLMVKGSHCYCKDYRDCIFDAVPPKTSKLSTISKINVALGKPSNQSSTWEQKSNEPSCGNDGNINIEFIAEKPLCVHTATYDKNPYYMINLLDVYSINHITIYWRTVTQNRHVQTRVLLDGKLCFKFETQSQVSYPSSVYCSSNMRGQIVRLEKLDADISIHGQDARPLNVCEVEVWVCWPGFWGSNCQSLCEDLLCGDIRPCDPFTGKCDIPPQRDTDFQGPLTKEGQVKPTSRPTKRPELLIPESVPETTTTTTTRPPEECLNWLYAICIIFVSILIAVGIYLSLTHSKRAEGGQDPNQRRNPSVGEGEVGNEDEKIPE